MKTKFVFPGRYLPLSNGLFTLFLDGGESTDVNRLCTGKAHDNAFAARKGLKTRT